MWCSSSTIPCEVSSQVLSASFQPVSAMRQQQRPISKNRGGSNGGGTLCNSDHALVKWKDGVYEGRITHDVNVDWIVNFDSVSPEYPETYAIEWRVLPKPRNGWPVYNGLVMDVSCKFIFHLAVLLCPLFSCTHLTRQQ